MEKPDVVEDKSSDFRRQLDGEEQLDYIFEVQAARHLWEMTKTLNQKEAAEKRELEANKLKEAEEEREREEREQQKVLAI